MRAGALPPPLREALACPVCHGPLAEDFSCAQCGLHFPVYQGIPCLFAPGKEDLWAQNQSGLAEFFQENPAVAQNLEQTPEEILNGADLAAKAGLLQIQGRFREAAQLHRAAWRRCYPAEYIRAFEAQLDGIAAQAADCPGPVVDIASGRGMLISCLLEKTAVPLAATDISPSVLDEYQASRWPEQLESGRLTHLAFDANAMPFADGSLPVLTSCLGLQNIPNPEKTVRELRRVCGGKLYVLCCFFSEEDRENQEAAARLGLAGAFSQAALTAMLEGAGWRVSALEGRSFRQPPTPEGEVVPGMRVDALPVRETEARFTTLLCE